MSEVVSRFTSWLIPFGVPTNDLRIVIHNEVQVGPVEVPLWSMSATIGDPQSRRALVGRTDWLWIDDEEWLRATGDLLVKGEKFPLGVELCDTTTHIQTESPAGSPGGSLLVFDRFTLAGIMLYDVDYTRPAWPEARLEVIGSEH